MYYILPHSSILSPLITNLKVELAGSPTSDLLRFAKNTILSEEANIDGSNVDFDSFNQMQVMLEGLFHLGTLAETMTVIKHSRIQTNFF